MAAAKVKAKTAREFAEQLAGILQFQKTPWQGYSSYIGTLQGFAAREMAKTGGGEAAAVDRKRLAAHLIQMTDLLTTMAEQAKIRDGIRRGAAAVPFEQRQAVYAQAGTEHLRLLTDFARLAAALPQGK